MALGDGTNIRPGRPLTGTWSGPQRPRVTWTVYRDQLNRMFNAEGVECVTVASVLDALEARGYDASGWREAGRIADAKGEVIPSMWDVPDRVLGPEFHVDEPPEPETANELAVALMIGAVAIALILFGIGIGAWLWR